MRTRIFRETVAKQRAAAPRSTHWPGRTRNYPQWPALPSALMEPQEPASNCSHPQGLVAAEIGKGQQ